MKKILSLVVTAALAISTIGTSGLITPMISASSNNSTVTVAPATGELASEVKISSSAAELASVIGVDAVVSISVEKGAYEDMSWDKISSYMGNASDEHLGVYAPYEIDLKVNGKQWTEVPGGKIELTFNWVPTGITSDKYDVCIVRVHNGVTELLPCTINGSSVTFKTDKFSTYALAVLPLGSTGLYKSGSNGGSSNSAPAQNTAAIDAVPKTGQQLPLVLLGLTVISAIGCVFTFRKKEN